jgi:hypothetical protein
MQCVLLLVMLTSVMYALPYRSDVEQFIREGLVEHVMHDGQC